MEWLYFARSGFYIGGAAFILRGTAYYCVYGFLLRIAGFMLRGAAFILCVVALYCAWCKIIEVSL